MEQFEILFPGNKKIDVQFDNFLIKTDQARESGGDETAPEPFDIFLASLGACAGIYVKSFCDIRKMDTRKTRLFLSAFFNEGQKLLDRIEITLHVEQAFPQKYIKPIIKAMNTCAVKNQLHPDINIETRVIYLES